MNVTRDVIYDLLPAYFAGEASADTCALIEAFFETDPEFGRMAARFRTLYEETHRADSGRESPFGDVQRFVSVRARVERLQTANGLAIGYAVAALFALVMGFVREPGNIRHPGYIIAAVFAVVALFSFAAGRLAGHGSPVTVDVPFGGRGYRRRPWRA